MELNDALTKDSADGGTFLKELDVIATQLGKFWVKYPNTFRHVCEQAIATGEMSLGDAVSALEWVLNALEGE